MAAMYTDIGNYRPTNEDYVDIDEKGQYGLYIVCDGVGGHQAGEIASKVAAELIRNYIREYYIRNLAPHILEAAVLKANHEILRMAEENPAYKGMGTTITCALDAGGEVFIAHVGDSSAYLIKGRQIAKLTRDHSLVQEMLDRGTISEEEKASHPSRNIITRSLGTREDLNVDIMEVPRSSFDHMLLCTDGLTDVITKDEMLTAYLKEPDDQKYVEMLAELAKQKGSRDNISLLIFGGERK